RHLVVDAVAFCFVAIFAFQAGFLLQESIVEGQSTHSAWGPPLWIPYLLLTVGMVVLALQLAQQVGDPSLVMLAVAAAGVFGLLPWNYWVRGPLPVFSGVPQPVLSIAFCVMTLIAMFSGMPIAFALGSVALGFMFLFMRRASVETIAQNVYEELA